MHAHSLSIIPANLPLSVGMYNTCKIQQAAAPSGCSPVAVRKGCCSTDAVIRSSPAAPNSFPACRCQLWASCRSSQQQYNAQVQTVTQQDGLSIYPSPESSANTSGWLCTLSSRLLCLLVRHAPEQRARQSRAVPRSDTSNCSTAKTVCNRSLSHLLAGAAPATISAAGSTSAPSEGCRSSSSVLPLKRGSVAVRISGEHRYAPIAVLQTICVQVTQQDGVCLT